MPTSTSFRVRAILLLAAQLLVVACGADEGNATTQVLVEVRADATVAARVVRVEASVHDAEGDASSAKHTQRFALGGAVAPSDAVTASFPFSFAITQNSAPAVRLEVVGYDSWSVDARPVISRAVIVRFVRGSSLTTSLLLAAPCLDQAAVCTAAGLTCSPDGLVRCVPVTDAVLGPASGQEPDATLPFDAGLADPHISDASLMDAIVVDTQTHDPVQRDAALADSSTLPSVGLDAAVVDAQTPELEPEPLPICPVANACPLAAYPCIPSDDGLGYSCRGQYAAWPMPDAQPDAKYAPSYTIDAAAGTVLDNVTGLLWQRDLPASYPGCTGRTAAIVGDSCTVQEAEHYCSQLTLADKRWRLPTKVELESLIYPLTWATGDAVIDLQAFPDTPHVDFWSASPVVVAPFVNMNYFTGFAGGLSTTAVRTDAKLVRCVRSAINVNAPPEARYSIDEQANTVHDNFTKLTWLRGQSASAVSAEEAKTFCGARGTGFRVPTHKELLTLGALTDSVSALDRVFVQDTVNWLSWSTTPSLYGSTLVYVSKLAATYVSEGATGDWSLHVRCVH